MKTIYFEDYLQYITRSASFRDKNSQVQNLDFFNISKSFGKCVRLSMAVQMRILK